MKSMTLFMSDSVPLGDLHRQLLPVPPLFPRSHIHADARVAEQPQGDIRMRGAVAALTIRDHFPIRCHTGVLIHRAEVVEALEAAVGRQITGPLDMHRAGNGAAAFRADRGAAVLTVGARVEDHRVAASERVSHVSPGGEPLLPPITGPLARLRRQAVAAHLESGGGPRLEP